MQGRNLMEIGKLKRSYTIEPIQDPVPAAKPEPADTPVRAVEADAAGEQPARP
jgi:hypothetical protein